MPGQSKIKVSANIQVACWGNQLYRDSSTKTALEDQATSSLGRFGTRVVVVSGFSLTICASRSRRICLIPSRGLPFHVRICQSGPLLFRSCNFEGNLSITGCHIKTLIIFVVSLTPQNSIFKFMDSPCIISFFLVSRFS